MIKTGHAAWALPISERLCRRFPQNADYTLMRARALWQSGRHDEAVQVLDILEAQRVFQDNFSGDVARLYAELGDRARAISSLELTTALDPNAVRSLPLYCELAKFYLMDGRSDEAGRLLATAYRNPVQSDMEPLMDYFEATGKLMANSNGELPVEKCRGHFCAGRNCSKPSVND